MAETHFDVTGIGNAIVDVLTQADDAFITEHGLEKGAMTLIDMETADKIYGTMGPAVEVSGGSAANTLAGLVSLGGRGAYIGKVRDDALGRLFSEDLEKSGEIKRDVSFDLPPDAWDTLYETMPEQFKILNYVRSYQEVTMQAIKAFEECMAFKECITPLRSVWPR